MRRDDAYLLDIVIAARKALQFVEGIDRGEFEDNELVQNAVMRPLEIIGEAEMVGLRNRLVHEYFRIDFGAVWDTIHKDLPKLIEIVEPLVPREDEI